MGEAMKWREFITMLGGAATTSTWSFAESVDQPQRLIAHAQIAFLGAESVSTT
jgi:hypothetical protein